MAVQWWNEPIEEWLEDTEEPLGEISTLRPRRLLRDTEKPKRERKKVLRCITSSTNG